MSAPIKISHAEYLAYPAISNSLLQRVGQSPAHAKQWLETPMEPTPAMILGTMTHAGILEPHVFKATYSVMPKFDGRTNAGKASKESWIASNPGKIAILEDQFTQVLGMIESVYNHPRAAEALSQGESEMSHFHRDAASGATLKCRPDHVFENTLIDIKTTEDASYKAFQKSIINFGYDHQAAFYLDLVTTVTGIKMQKFIIIAVEKKAPYAVAIYQLDDLAIQVGRNKVRANINLWLECLRTGVYPAYGDEIVTMSLPGWAV